MSAVRDADALAALLTPGSIDRMHRQLDKAVLRFLRDNAESFDRQTVIAVIATHMLALLHETVQAMGGAREHGAFVAYIAASAAMIERGEPLRGMPQ